MSLVVIAGQQSGLSTNEVNIQQGFGEGSRCMTLLQQRCWLASAATCRRCHLVGLPEALLLMTTIQLEAEGPLLHQTAVCRRRPHTPCPQAEVVSKARHLQAPGTVHHCALGIGRPRLQRRHAGCGVAVAHWNIVQQL